jgi:hypothetical protein
MSQHFNEPRGSKRGGRKYMFISRHDIAGLFIYFIHSETLIVQDGPLASLSGFLDHTHIKTHGRTPLDE